MSYRGIIDLAESVWARLQSGEDVDPSEYYPRGQPMYEAAIDCPYSGLNSIIAVAVGKQEPLGVTYDVYQIL